jgi:hypothetical protein
MFEVNVNERMLDVAVDMCKYLNVPCTHVLPCDQTTNLLMFRNSRSTFSALQLQITSSFFTARPNASNQNATSIGCSYLGALLERPIQIRSISYQRSFDKKYIYECYVLRTSIHVSSITFSKNRAGYLHETLRPH